VKPPQSEGSGADLVHALRMTASAYFTTVLSPGDPDHAEHLNIDLAVHRATPNYRICE